MLRKALLAPFFLSLVCRFCHRQEYSSSLTAVSMIRARVFVTAEAHAHVRFRRAIEHRALWMAEDAARELPSLPLEERSAARPPLRRALAC
jgi:hypothetical protein